MNLERRLLRAYLRLYPARDRKFDSELQAVAEQGTGQPASSEKDSKLYIVRTVVVVVVVVVVLFSRTAWMVHWPEIRR